MTIYAPSTVIPVYSVLTSVGIILTCLRFWVRTYHTTSTLGADDILIVAGVTVVVACTAIQLYNAVDGTGGEALSDEDQASRALIAQKVNYAMTVIEKAAFGAIKLSLLLFYRRIFGVWHSFRRLNKALMVFIALWAFLFILGDLLICGKDIALGVGLDQTKALHACGDKGILLIAFAASSILTDALVLGLPLFYVHRLQMTLRKKIAAGLAFFLGTV